MTPNKQQQPLQGSHEEGEDESSAWPEQPSRAERSDLDRMIFARAARNLASFRTPAAPRDDSSRQNPKSAALTVRAAPPAASESSQPASGYQGAKIKWDAANDRKLLLFGLEREMSGREYQRIAGSFPEKPTRKAIENRVLRLRKESLALLKDTGIHDPDPDPVFIPAGGSSDVGGKRADKRPRLMPAPPPPVRTVSWRPRSMPPLTRNNLDVPFGPPEPWADGEEDDEEWMVEEMEDGMEEGIIEEDMVGEIDEEMEEEDRDLYG